MLILAIGGALVAAAAQMVVLEWRLRVLGHIAWGSDGVPVGRDITWMSPLAYLLAFALPAALLLLVALVAPRRMSVRVPAIVFGFLCAFGILLLFPAIHQYASMLLAVGIAVQLGRWAAGNPAGFVRRTGRVAVVLAAAFTLLGVLTRTARGLGERRAMAALPSPPARAPNVLLIILDTVRASSMSLYGYERATTPRLEQLARRSVVFDQAFVTAPWTLPTHATIFTGRYAGELSTRWLRGLDERDRTLAEALAAKGYASAGFVANAFYTTHETGLARGFARYEDVNPSLRQVYWSSTLAQTPFLTRIVKHRSVDAVARAVKDFDFRIGESPTYDRRRAARINREFLAWQRELGGRPFFAFLNYFDAHGPYDPPKPFDTRFAGDPKPQDRYDGGIAYMDAQIDRLLGELERRGVLDNTIVIVTSDHGELFGEWGGRGHGNNVYLPLLRVPLLVSFPARVPQGMRVSESVTVRDLPRTITALTGLHFDREFPGVSLAALWDADSASAERSPVIADFEGGDEPDEPDNAGPMVSVIDDSLQYIRHADGREELYDLRTAMSDHRDLSAEPRLAEALAAIRARAAGLGRARPIIASR